jgi:hypothetical protein
MLPELKLKYAFPGFGSIELQGACRVKEDHFHEVTIKFVPSETCQDKEGVLIKITRTGDCYVEEIKPLTAEDFEVTGIA